MRAHPLLLYNGLYWRAEVGVVGGAEQGVDYTPLILFVAVVLLVKYRRNVWSLLTRWSPRPLKATASGAPGTWTAADRHLLEAAQLAAQLEQGPPQPPEPPFALKRRERLLFAVSDCGVSILDVEQLSVPRWRTSIFQKHGLGYVVTPLINSVRNANARSRAKSQMRRSATWTEPEYGRVYLTNRRLIAPNALNEAISLRSVGNVKRESRGVSFQVGAEGKLNLEGHARVYAPNDDWFYVALVYAIRRRPPKLRLSDSFKARAADAGHRVPEPRS